MSVARISGPKLLDAPLRPPEEPVDVETVGVGRHLRRDPGDRSRERLCQRPVHPEDPLEGREAHLHLLAYRRPPVRLLGGQQHAGPGQILPEFAAAVGQVPEEPPRDAVLIETGPGQQLPHEEHVRGVGGRQLVGEGDALRLISATNILIAPISAGGGRRKSDYPPT